MSKHTPRQSNAQWDVVGIGNALVDVLVFESDAKVADLGIIKGAMNLVDGARSDEIYAAVGPGVEISGGSVSNSMVGIANLGSRAGYMGKVRADQLGKIFRHDITANGVDFRIPAAEDGPATGCCIILVTPDAERSMNTFLGASVFFGPEDVDPEMIAGAHYVFLEGYLFDPPAAQAAFRHAAELAHAAGRKVALTLSDSFCVERHREAFLDLVENHVDVVFANEHEVQALYQTATAEEAVETIRGRCGLAAVTRSVRGSQLITADDTVEIPSYDVGEVVDTTAAGDLYAAGVLHGLAQGYPLEVCGRLGSIAAAEVITHLGARPRTPLRELQQRVFEETGFSPAT